MTLKPEDFTWVSPNTPAKSGTYDAYADRYWSVNAKGEIAIYRRTSPQCNMNRDIALKLSENVPGAVGVHLIPIVFLPHRCEDYR